MKKKEDLQKPWRENATCIGLPEKETVQRSKSNETRQENSRSSKGIAKVVGGVKPKKKKKKKIPTFFVGPPDSSGMAGPKTKRRRGSANIGGEGCHTIQTRTKKG